MTTLIQQRSGNDCVLAAIAMALGKERWEDAWHDDDLKTVVESKGIGNVDPWLERHGLKRNEDYRSVHVWSGADLSVVRALLWGRRALLSVESLNNEGGTHMVYWDGEQLFDPHEGHYPEFRAFKYVSTLRITEVIVFKEQYHVPCLLP